jgi:serine/threonine-protein kinase
MSEEAEILARAAQRVGTVLHAKYHLDGVLGVGGMATVYAATHRNRKRFAVKMLHPEFSVRSELRARFIREGYVANSVAHPGVVAVLDDDVDETGSAFLVMELLEGAPVDALYELGGTPLPLREALGIIYQLLEVLQAAHQKAVVHRDIKPANLFVLRDGQLKVLDFGIARLREGDAALKSTRTGATLGTPAFMAPEQARAMPDAIDARTDIWGVGATLFTLLTACFVHEGENARQIMIHAATQPARPIEGLLPDLPATVAAIVSRALEFESSRRWPSAAAMREAVLEAYRALFGGEPVRADIAELLARTSASVACQATERAALVNVPSLQTTASTPLTTRRPAGTRKARWVSWALASAAALAALMGVLALRTPASSPVVPFTAAASPATRIQPAFVEPAPAPAPQAAPRLSSSAVATSVPPAPGPKRSAARTSRPPTPAASASSATPAAVAVSPAPANPLQLELQ